MTTKPLYFVHITDTHLKAPTKESFLKIDTVANLRAVLAQVRSLAFKPAFVIITGDLAHEGDAEDYRFIKNLLDEESAALDAPILVALGNHDHREAFNDGFLGQPDSDTPHYYMEDFDGVRVIVLDSNWPGKDAGMLDEEQLDWLQEELDNDAVRGTVLFIHHPPHVNSFFSTSDHLLTNNTDLADVIEGSDVMGILSGHIHFNSSAGFYGILSVTGQATAFGLDASVTTGMRMIEAYGYNLCIVQDHDLIVQPVELPTSRRELLFMTFEELAKATEHGSAEEALSEHASGQD